MRAWHVDALSVFVAAARIWSVLSIGYSYAAIGLTSLLSSCGTTGRLEVLVAFFHALVKYISIIEQERFNSDMRSNNISDWKLVSYLFLKYAPFFAHSPFLAHFLGKNTPHLFTNFPVRYSKVLELFAFPVLGMLTLHQPLMSFPARICGLRREILGSDGLPV